MAVLHTWVLVLRKLMHSLHSTTDWAGKSHLASLQLEPSWLHSAVLRPLRQASPLGEHFAC